MKKLVFILIVSFLWSCNMWDLPRPDRYGVIVIPNPSANSNDVYCDHLAMLNVITYDADVYSSLRMEYRMHTNNGVITYPIDHLLEGSGDLPLTAFNEYLLEGSSVDLIITPDKPVCAKLTSLVWNESINLSSYTIKGFIDTTTVLNVAFIEECKLVPNYEISLPPCL